MKTIHKFPIVDALYNGGRFGLRLSDSARVLDAQLQRGVLTILALVDTEPQNSNRARDFLIVATGQEIDEVLAPRLIYIATVQHPHSGYVWHIFEVTYSI